MTDSAQAAIGGGGKRWLRIAFSALVAFPVVRLWLGLTVRNRDRLPLRGPAIIAANHNSHLDICTLLTLFPLAQAPDIRPAAAADYFMKGGALSWVARNLVGIIPVVRNGAPPAADGSREDPLEACYEALAAGNILIIFPEGTRGEPGEMQALKAGISFLAKRFPEAPVVPLYMDGLDRAMPKGTWIPLPFFVDINVGMPLSWKDDAEEDKTVFMARLTDRFHQLRRKVLPETPPA
jgi:1-acyl-sn-glycerol-3-phosphate acyltransferase